LRKRGRSTDRLGYVQSREVGNPWQFVGNKVEISSNKSTQNIKKVVDISSNI